MKLGFVIGTCKSYFSNVKDILNDIDEAGLNKKNIIIVSAQEESNEDYIYRNVKIIKVPYTGLQLTGLIYLYENKDLYKNIDYWFTLPCTIKIGKTFNRKINDYFKKVLNEESIPIINPKLLPLRTMDMGILKNKFINNMGEYLMKTKLDNFNNKDLLRLKKQLIFNENIILGLPPANPKFATKFNIKNKFKKPENFMINKFDEIESRILNHHNGNQIKETKFLPIDLIKYQRCFHGTKNLIMDCDGKRPFS